MNVVDVDVDGVGSVDDVVPLVPGDAGRRIAGPGEEAGEPHLVVVGGCLYPWL